MAYSGYEPDSVPILGWIKAFARPRYLSLAIHTYVALYVTLTFGLLVFNATSLLDRWVLELTPLLILGYRELPLVLLSAAVAGLNAYVHYSFPDRGRLVGMGITVLMVASLILALRTSPYYFDPLNVSRLAVLGALLATVPLDHLSAARQVASYPEERYQPWESSAVVGPQEPEAFDDAMASVDEALFMLDQSPKEEGDREEMAELATNLLEELLDVFEDEEAAPGEATASSTMESPLAAPDPMEVRRRQSLFENRIRSIEERLMADPTDVDALFAKGTYLAMQKRTTEAIEALDRVTQLDPRYPGVWFFKAKIHQMLGNVRMAELCLRRAAEVEEEPP